MKLKKLILCNYKQHAHKEVTFDGNIIGVIGPNGSGKSNLLGAIHFALAGEQPGFNKSDLLRWGETEGSVELHFEHDGVGGSILRSLHSTAVHFKFGHEETTGNKKAEERISTLLGMDKDLLKQAIFVRQAEIDAILFTDPRIRELSFQKLCGIGEAAKIHKKLGDELAEMALPPNYDEQIAEAQLRYKDMKERWTGLQAQAATMRANREKCPSFSDMQKILSSQEQLSFVLDRLKKLDYDKTIMTLGVTQDEAKLAGVNVPDVDVNELDKQITGLQELMKQTELYHRALREFEASGKAIVSLGAAPVKPPLPFTDVQLRELEKAANDLKQSYEQIRAEVWLYDGLKKAVEGKLTAGTECPICGHPVTDTSRLIHKLQACREVFTKLETESMAAAGTFSTAFSKNKATEDMATRQTMAYQTQYAHLVKQYKLAEAILDGTKKVDEDTIKLEWKLTELTDLRKQVLAGNSLRAQLTADLKSHREYLAKVTTDWTEATSKVMADNIAFKDMQTGISIDQVKTGVDGRITTLKLSIGEVQKLDQGLAQLDGMIHELETGVKELENTISKLEYKRSQQDEYRKAMKVLNDVRDWFHYSNGPHTLASSVLSEMVQDVNTFLEEFSAPFTVISADDAMGFKYIMHDGSAMPDTPPDAIHLSGGQRIQLAVAFRFAAYCMFANKLGILSLDEPTVYLDDYHVGRFCALLEKIKHVAQKMGLQVLIATHEQSVIPFIDTLVDLNDTQKVDSKNE